MRTASDEGLPTGPEKTARVRAMFDAIAPRYDMLNRIMTLGLDQMWRRSTIDALGLAPGSFVLDLACGTGDLGSIARRRAAYRTIGVDLSWGMLQARREGQPVVQADVLHLPLSDASVDGVVCGYALRNFTDLEASLAEVGRVVRPGGRLAVLEVARPAAGLLRTGHRLWFERVVPLLGGALSDRTAYRYLPRSMAYLPDEAGLRALLRSSGFSTVGCRMLQGGLSQLLTATRSGRPVALRGPRPRSERTEVSGQ
jgi:demethylmenaquinone methyltransferase / 2-methoxy-6-polyprenyl-1,4-benzoquinol methylase